MNSKEIKSKSEKLLLIDGFKPLLIKLVLLNFGVAFCSLFLFVSLVLASFLLPSLW